MSYSLEQTFSSNYTVFHRYWICQETITPYKKKNYGNIKYSTENSNLGSTVYKCRLVPEDPNHDYNRYYAMKVISFLKSPTLSSSSQKSRQINPFAKNIQQIQTEYTVLQLLNKCHRIAKYQQIILQNPKREDDKQFFYSFLKKGKASGQRYICLITQFCNEGDLDSIVQAKYKSLTEEIVIGYAAQIIQGLLQLKKKRIIHRDLRLCNILVHNGEIKFSDFDTSFIGGKSTWQDVKNGIDIETSPPQIIQLASKPDQQLKRYDSDDLYQRQQKSDIYFFGLALFKMIFGYNYQKFNIQTLSNMIQQKLQTSTYSKNLLDLLVHCLYEKSQKRIDFVSLYKKFKEIQKIKYYEERVINKLYLSEEPFCFSAEKNMDLDGQNLDKLEDDVYNMGRGLGIEIDFHGELKKSQNNRLTFLYQKTFCRKSPSQMNRLWLKIHNDQQSQSSFLSQTESFIQTISTHSYYYQCLYKAILCINLRSLSLKPDIKYVSQSKLKLQRQLSIILSFLFKMLFKTPFTRDKRYNSSNLTYEGIRLFRSIIREDYIQNKMHCYFGKSRQFDYMGSASTKKINAFFQVKYQQEDCFQPLYNNIISLIQQLDFNMNQLLKNTIINLRLAYQNIYKKQSSQTNIKQILFILISLQQIDLSTIKKNQIIVIWNQLLPLINQQIQLDKEQIDFIFQDFSNLYKDDQFKITGDKMMHTISAFALEDGLGGGKNGEMNGDGVEGEKGELGQAKLFQFDAQDINVDIDDIENVEIKKQIQLLENQNFENNAISVSSIKSKKNSPIVTQGRNKQNQDQMENNSQIIAKY